MDQNLTSPARYLNDQADKEVIDVDVKQLTKEFIGIKNKLKMDKIDKKCEKEYVLNTQYTSQRKVI